MTESRDNQTPEIAEASRAWYRAAIAAAFIGAAFSLVVCVFMAANFRRSRIIDTPAELKLLALRAEVPDRPDDERLLSGIRELDLEMRQKRARAIFRSRSGSYLLLGGVIVFLIGAKCADSLRKKLPERPSAGDPQKRQVRDAMWSRLAVSGGVAMLALGVYSLMAGPKVNFQSGPPVAPYPSIDEINKNWPAFRGPNGNGISAYTNIPTKWDGETGAGILWKTKVPIGGYNSPVVWADRVFLAGGDANDLQVYCFDTASGDLLWTGDVTRVKPKPGEDPYEPYEDTGFSTPTVVTDGRRVYAIFVTGDIGCFDFNGKKIWEKSLGLPDSAYGYAASLAIYQDKVLIQFDQGAMDDGISEMIALDGPTGNVSWKTKRPVANSWSSPIVTQINDKFRLITSSDPWVIAYDPAGGKELWRAECLVGDIAATPIYANGLVFAMEPYSKTVAIRPDGQGEVTETHIAWTNEEGGPDICSPVCDGEVLLNLADGLLSCLKVTDGTLLWEEDLRAYFMASPSLVGDKLYLLDEDGTMSIAEYKPKYKELTKCSLGEKCHASPAFADGRIYIRGHENLYCIGGSEAGSAPETPYPSIEEVNKNWPSFRGPNGNGISAYTNIPTKWDAETGNGILWKTKIPVGGNNSPVVWDDRVFLAGGDANDLQVYCFGADSGDLHWTGDVTRVRPKPGEDPYEPYQDTGYSTPTVVTDGRRVYVIFVTGDVGCFDFNGKKVWEKSLGLPDSAYGYAASPAIYQDKVLIQFDQGGMDDGISEMIALDGPSGDISWKTKRPVANSWSSPIVTKIDDKFQLITSSDPWVIAYDPAGGKELWRAECLVGDIAATPVYAGGLVFAMEPYSKTVAIRPDGQGEVTESHIAWANEDGGPDICSPVCDGEVLLNLADGLLSCLKVTDGTLLWEEDLRAYFMASPSLVGDKLYLLDEDGTMSIAEYKPKYKELTKCKLGEKCHASPAFVDGRIYIRAFENLYCIGNKATQEP